MSRHLRIAASALSCAVLAARAQQPVSRPAGAAAPAPASASPGPSQTGAAAADPWAPSRALLLGIPADRLQPAHVVQAGRRAVELGQFAPLAEIWLGYFHRSYRPDILGWPGALAAMNQWRLASLLAAPGSAVESAPRSLVERILAGPAASGLFATTIRQEDDLPKVLELLGRLERRFGAATQEYTGLALALAVVWDQPPTQPYHGQVSPSSLLPLAPDIEARFAFFVEGDRAGRMEYPLRQLAPAELIYVVDAPVPVSELEWAQRRVRGSAASWGRKFYDITYSYYRADGGLLNWNPEEMYTLENIQRLGGICVDQAYFAAVTAKAHGIPSMYFSGTGRRGDHAWFGYMRRRGRWELDAGRYFQDNYVTGYAIDPQTRRHLSDHEIDLLIEARVPERARGLALLHLFAADQFGRTGRVDLAVEAAAAARAVAPALLEPWQATAAYLARLPGAETRLLAFYDEMAAAFRDEADVQGQITQARAELARRYHGTDLADRILERAADRQGRNRYDVALDLARTRIRELEADGKIEGAIEVYRDTISEYRAERAAVLDLLAEAVAFHERHGRTEDGVDLVEWSLRRIQPTWGDGDLTYAKAMAILASAHEANGDTREAERIRERWLPTGTE